MKDVLTQGNDVADMLMEQIGHPIDVQVKKVKYDWDKIAKENIVVEKISGTFYGYGSELATLRLLQKYTANGQVANKKTRAGFSKNKNKFYFELET